MRILVYIQTLLVAIFLDTRAINRILAYGGFSEEGLLNILYPLCILLMVSVGYLLKKYRMCSKVDRYVIVLVLLLPLYYFFTSYFVAEPFTSITLFLALCVAALLLPQYCKIEARPLLIFTMIIPSVAIFKMDQVFASYLDWSESISMDACYAFLVPITAACVYALTYLNEDSMKVKLLILPFLVINFLFFLRIAMYGSRGPIVSLVITLLFFYTVRKKEDIGIIVSKKRLFTVVLLSLVLYFTFIDLLISIVGFLGDFGLEVTFFEKFLNLAKEGDVSNGRKDIASIAIKGFLSSPFWGNGMDSFNANTGLAYPHNLFLQLLYDGGLLLSAVIILPILKKIKRTYHNCSYDEYTVYTFLLMCSVPGSMFSMDIWSNGVLWFAFGSLFVKKILLANE